MTALGDYVFEWGRESEIYFPADLRPASRWVHNRAYVVGESIIVEVLADCGCGRIQCGCLSAAGYSVRVLAAKRKG